MMERDELFNWLEVQLADKQQGFAIHLAVAEDLYPDTDPPRIEIFMLDPQEEEIAFRRVSDQGKEQWRVGELIDVVEDALDWEAELCDPAKEEDYECE